MSNTDPDPETRIALFQRREVRRTIHSNEWWFVVEDVVLALTNSADPKQYIQRMKQRDTELGKGWVHIVQTLSVTTAGGPQNKHAARSGGTVAGNARRELEKKSGRTVVTSDNYLALTQSTKKTHRLAGKSAKKS